jgi:hypothetical protein
MKKILVMIVCSLALVACQDDAEKITSSDNKKLGVIIQNTDNVSSNALILLKDGRTISPLYGFESFPSTQIGKKFLLSFNVISEVNGIYNVDVNNVVLAEDSVFTFTTPPLSHSDSVATAEFIAGTFTGSFTYCLDGDCNSGQTTLTITGEDYSTTKDENNFPVGGAGTMSLSDLSNHKITFTNNLEFASIDPNLILNGTFDVHAFDNYLSLLRWNGNTLTSYVLKKQ